MKRMGLISVVASIMVLAAASQAGAHEFVASKTGKLKGKALSNQVLKASGSGLEVVCAQATASGEMTATKSAELEVSYELGECTAFGFLGAKVTLADYTLLAAAGVSLLKAALIIEAGGCKVEVSVSQTFNKAGEVEYVNKSGKIEVRFKLTGIHSKTIEDTAFGEPCGKAGEERTTGTFQGNDELELEGGTIEWK